MCQTISYGIHIRLFYTRFTLRFIIHQEKGSSFSTRKCNAAILKCAGCITKEGSSLLYTHCISYISQNCTRKKSQKNQIRMHTLSRATSFFSNSKPTFQNSPKIYCFMFEHLGPLVIYSQWSGLDSFFFFHVNTLK